MKILCITKRTPRDLFCFDQTYAPYIGIKQTFNINERYDIIVVDEVEELVYVADLSKMMLQNKDIMNAADWDALELLLTEALLVAYKTKSYIPKQRFTVSGGKVKLIPNTTEDIGLDIDLSLFHMEGMVTTKIISATHSLDIEESYGTRNNPSLRNVRFLRHRLEDVIFTHKKTIDRPVNFTNTIPVVSGKVHYPIVYNDELYAINATDALKNLPEGGMGNVLIDFSPIGNIDLVRFPDCEIVPHPTQKLVRMPFGKSFTNKTALFIIGGRFVMSSELKIVDDRTFAFNPYAIPLKNIILSNKAILGDKIPGTMIIQDTDPSGTFAVKMMEEENYDNFIILIDNPTVDFYMLASDMMIKPNMLRFPPEAGGVLIKNFSREVIDYSKELETDHTIVYLAPTQPLNRIINEDANNMHNIAYQSSSIPDFEYAINDKDDGFTIISIVAEEL